MQDSLARYGTADSTFAADTTLVPADTTAMAAADTVSSAAPDSSLTDATTDGNVTTAFIGMSNEYTA